MRIHRGAIAHSGAGIVPALGFPFASVQAATHMLFPQQEGRIVCVTSFGRVAGQGCAQHHAAKSGHRQFAKVTSRQGCVSNNSSLFHVHSFLPLMIRFNATHTEVGPMNPPFYSREEQKPGATNSPSVGDTSFLHILLLEIHRHTSTSTQDWTLCYRSPGNKFLSRLV